MISILMAATLAVGLPPEMVGVGEDGAFDVWLRAEVDKSIVQLTGATCAEPRLSALPTVSGGSPYQYLPPQVAHYAVDPVQRISVVVENCGEPRRHNFMVLRVRNLMQWMAMPMTPGDTFASPRLQRDLLPTLFQAMSVGLSCSAEEIRATYRPTDTVIVSSGEPGEPWVERWPATVCGQIRTVEISFTPTPADGGTDFAIRPAWD